MSDLHAVNARLRQVVAGKDELIAAQDEMLRRQAEHIETQDERIGAQGELIKQLQEEMADLRRRMGMDSTLYAAVEGLDRGEGEAASGPVVAGAVKGSQSGWSAGS